MSAKTLVLREMLCLAVVTPTFRARHRPHVRLLRKLKLRLNEVSHCRLGNSPRLHYLLDERLAPEYSRKWVKLCPTTIAPASCWRFAFLGGPFLLNGVLAMVAVHSSSANKSFRINTCKSVSKQTTLSAIRINTYEKRGGGVGSPCRPRYKKVSSFPALLLWT